MEDKKKVGLIVTAVTAVLCGCPGLCSLVFGASMSLGGGIDSEFVNTSGDPLLVGIVFLCIGLLMTVIPVGAGIYTFLQSRKEETPAEEIGDIPPAI
jgi:hypothetical protein